MRFVKDAEPCIAPGPQVGNPKRATIVRVADGAWRLFFESAEGGASKIGGPSLDSDPQPEGDATDIASAVEANGETSLLFGRRQRYVPSHRSAVLTDLRAGKLARKHHTCTGR